MNLFYENWIKTVSGAAWYALFEFQFIPWKKSRLGLFTTFLFSREINEQMLISQIQCSNAALIFKLNKNLINYWDFMSCNANVLQIFE